MSRLGASGIWVVESHRCDGFFLQENIVKVEVMKFFCVSLQKVLLSSEKWNYFFN
jgi:hypothetical protein